MKHISLVLLPVLLLSLLVPFAAMASTPGAKSAQVGPTATPTGPDGNDCDHDGGNNPGDDVCTPTPPACTPTLETANVAKVAIGQPVEGLGLVAPHLNISSQLRINGVKDRAVRVAAGSTPVAYVAFGPRGANTVANGGVDSRSGGFADPLAAQNKLAASFLFTFNVPVSNFRVRMLDYGDYNPEQGTVHTVTLNVYGAASSAPIFTQTLSYNTPAQRNRGLVAPTWSDRYGNLQINGDALRAPAPASGQSGMPGKWMWRVDAKGIRRVTLVVVPGGQDPDFALDNLSFRFFGNCPSATPTP